MTAPLEKAALDARRQVVINAIVSALRVQFETEEGAVRAFRHGIDSFGLFVEVDGQIRLEHLADCILAEVVPLA